MSDTETPIKPGFKTTEFWLALVATIAGGLIASGALAEGSTVAVIVGGVVTVLAQLGYGTQRTVLKKAEVTAK